MSERFAHLLKKVDWSAPATKEQSIAQTKSEAKAMTPPPPGLDLTAEEWQRVRQAYASGLEREETERWHAKQAPQVRRDLNRFLKFWHRLSQGAKNDLAEPGEDTDFYEGTATEYQIVLRAKTALRFWKPLRGRPLHFRYFEAANALATICNSRGVQVRPGRIHADKKSLSSLYQPNAFVEFVSRALRHLDPAIKTDSSAQRVAKSAVDNLRHQGLI
jgi:hypothetical protein